MTATPTRAELNTEVDRQFHERYPDAPAKLDDDGPGQADLERPGSTSTSVVNEWTNKVFFEHFPAAGKSTPRTPPTSC